MLDTLDALIATAAVILGLSLIVQAIQQIIKQFASFKSSYMERELITLFGDLEKKTIWSKLVPTWIQFLWKRWMDKSDAKELVQTIKKKVAGLGYNDLSLLETMKKEDFAKLIALLEPDSAKLEKWKEDVENWYDLTMKAFQDHYERRMKAWSYVIGLLVVLWMNANIFDIYKEFSSNKVLRDAAVKMAERLTAIPRDSLIVVKTTTKNDTLQKVSDTLALRAIRRHIQQIDSLVESKSFHIMRWNTAGGDHMASLIDSTGILLGLVGRDFWAGAEKNGFGWIAMAFLVGLGATFWYDFLKTIMGIKNYLGGKSATRENSNSAEGERRNVEGVNSPEKTRPQKVSGQRRSRTRT